MAHVTAEMKAAVERKVAECINVAHEKLGVLIDMPTIVYRKRGTTAGTADYRQWVINLNPVLLVENFDDFLARTVPHETAHLIDYQMNPENFNVGADFCYTTGRYRRQKRDMHGASWKRIMHTLGADPSRCHSYDVTNAKIKRRGGAKHSWTCKTCGSKMELGPQRHANMISGQRRYWLRGCGRHAGFTYDGDADALRREAQAERDFELRANGMDPSRTVDLTDLFRQAEKLVKPKGSSKDIARECWKQCGGIRGAFISLATSKGIKKTTASTYFQNFKSGKWS